MWKGQHFVLAGIRTYSGLGLAFPAHNASIQTPVGGLTECLIHPHGIAHGIASDPGTHFTAKEVCQRARAHRIHWSHHVCSPHPEAAALIEQWNGLLRTQLQCWLGGDSLQAWSKVRQKAVYALSQHPANGALSPIAGIHGFRNQGVEMAPTPQDS